MSETLKTLGVATAVEEEDPLKLRKKRRQTFMVGLDHPSHT